MEEEKIGILNKEALRPEEEDKKIYEQKEKVVKKHKFPKKKFFIILVIIISFIYVSYAYILSLPLKNDDIYCEYKSKFNKIICTQTGDVVPAWLDLDDAPLLKYLGGSSIYTMKLVISKSNKDYKVLNMTDKEFIRDRNRKFIYELKEQTYKDWLELKNYMLTGSINNWGSIVLYCSENNLKENICKRMKKNHR